MTRAAVRVRIFSHIVSRCRCRLPDTTMVRESRRQFVDFVDSPADTASTRAAPAGTTFSPSIGGRAEVDLVRRQASRTGGSGCPT
jgi:hypothetical protein